MKSYFVWQTNFWDRFREKLPEYRLRPHTGKLWLDFIYVLVIVALETSLLRSVSGDLRLFDLLTPWVCVSILRKRTPAALALCLWAGFVKESQSAIPAWSYVCMYWIIGVLIVQGRQALTWRYASAWTAMFTAAVAFMFSFELFLLLFLARSIPWSAYFVLESVLRLGISIGFGMFLARPWLRFDAEEPVPT